jgi:hypothetical protein
MSLGSLNASDLTVTEYQIRLLHPINEPDEYHLSVVPVSYGPKSSF